MITDTLRAIATAARSVFKNWQSTLAIAVVYACLLLVLYFFIVVREATLLEVSITFIFAIAGPLLFFILQTMVANSGSELTTGSLLRRSLTNFWKVILISLPLIAVGLLIAYLLGKAQAHFATNVGALADHLPRRLATSSARDHAPPIDWKAVTLSTLRYLTFGLVLPLIAIHAWLAAAREGLGSAIRKVHKLLWRSFTPESVLIYIAGFLIFAVAPYLLLLKTTSTKHAWLEISLLVIRLAIVFVLTLFGWMITVRALLLSATTTRPDPANEVV